MFTPGESQLVKQTPIGPRDGENHFPFSLLNLKPSSSSILVSREIFLGIIGQNPPWCCDSPLVFLQFFRGIFPKIPPLRSLMFPPEVSLGLQPVQLFLQLMVGCPRLLLSSSSSFAFAGNKEAARGYENHKQQRCNLRQ